MPGDVNLLAHRIGQLSTSSTVDDVAGVVLDEMVVARTRRKNPAAVALGRLGGQKGGKARAAKLSSQRRKAIASKAAKARWAKAKG